MSRKTIMITGATSGIGEATAHIFAHHNWNLIITGRRAERLVKLKDELTQKYQIEVLDWSFDVRSLAEMKTILEKNKTVLKDLDVLLNNAGLALGKSGFEAGDYEDWETMIDTNLKGMLYMTREIVPYFIEKKKGHIINISSTAAKVVYPGGNVYSATKFAVDGLTKGLRIDLLPYQIKVTSISPGMVDTEFSQVRFHGDKDKADKVYEGFTPLYANDVAETIYFVASRPDSVCINDLEITATAQANSVFVEKKQ